MKRLLSAILWGLLALTPVAAQTLNPTQTVHVTSLAALKALSKTPFGTTHPVVVAAGLQSGTFLRNNSDISTTLVFQTDIFATVSSAADTLTKTDHGLYTGDAVLATAAVNGLLPNTVYYVIRTSTSVIQLATTLANAWAETEIDLTGTTSTTLENLRDPLQAVYVVTTGDALNGDNGAWLRQGPLSPVEASWFGAVADGTTDDVIPLTAAIKFAEARFGGTVRLVGTGLCSQTSLPLYVNRDGVWLEGHSAQPSLGTCIRGTNADWPVIRFTAGYGGMKRVLVTASGARLSATIVTGLGATAWDAVGKFRDQQNYGIWVEGYDEATQQNVGYFYFENVWVANQPNSGWVFTGVTYEGATEGGGATANDSAGLVITDGFYTDRVNTVVAGIIQVRNFESYENLGHAAIVGWPDSPRGNVLRVTFENFDSYNNASVDARLVSGATDYEVYFVADNSTITNSAINGDEASATDDHGAIYVGGAQVIIENTRLLDMDRDLPAITFESAHPGTGTSSGLEVRWPTLDLSSEGGTMACLVNFDGGQGYVFAPTVAGSYTAAGCGAGLAFAQRINTADGILFDTGTYTPTLTNTTNVAASTAFALQWTRVYNRCTVSGIVQIDPTATATNTVLGMSLPPECASDFTSTLQAGGAAASVTTTINMNFGIASDATNNRLNFQGASVGTSPVNMYFSAMFQIL